MVQVTIVIILNGVQSDKISSDFVLPTTKMENPVSVLKK
jgi:hypothetical protein